MKKTRLSRNKILLEHNVPIRIKGSDIDVSNLDIKIRYKWSKDYGKIPSKEGFVIMISDIHRALETLAFKWKACKAIRTGSRYTISGVEPRYTRKTVDGLDLLVVNYIQVEDKEFIQKLRDHKLSELI
jgi:hypothetical protein